MAHKEDKTPQPRPNDTAELEDAVRSIEAIGEGSEVGE
jgi:hypothetical protein